MLLHNFISEIGRNDLVLLYALTELNLSYNKLTSPKVHREAFRKLRLLKKLDMSGNNLLSMPLGLPRSLQELEIKNNQLNSIPDGALTGMGKLQKLILSNNNLKLNSVYQGVWMELSALSVSVWKIHISDTGAWTFKNLKRLCYYRVYHVFSLYPAINRAKAGLTLLHWAVLLSSGNIVEWSNWNKLDSGPKLLS